MAGQGRAGGGQGGELCRDPCDSPAAAVFVHPVSEDRAPGTFVAVDRAACEPPGCLSGLTCRGIIDVNRGAERS